MGMWDGGPIAAVFCRGYIAQLHLVAEECVILRVESIVDVAHGEASELFDILS